MNTYRIYDIRSSRSGRVRAADERDAALQYGLQVDDNGTTYNRYGDVVGYVEQV